MKAHLKDTALPIVEGSDVTANCGVVVRKAVAVGVIDHEIGTGKVESRSSFMFCRDCANLLSDTGAHEWIRYTYALVDGEQSKHREAA